MKKANFQRLLYLGILACFALATGIPTAIYEWSQLDRPPTQDAYTKAEYATLEITPDNFFKYSSQLYEKRKKEVDTKGIYEPMDYFRDLKQFDMFRHKYLDSLNKDRSKISIVLGITNSINCLAGIRDENWKKYPLVDRKKITEARWYWYPSEKAADIENEKQSAKITLSSTLTWFMGWLLRFYLQGMPGALVLFLIWKFNLKKDFAEAVKWYAEKPQMYFSFTPFSFLVSLLAWPIILGVDIYNRAEETFRRVDVISRRGKMLSLFSKQEERLIELGKKMTRGEFKEHLDSIGMVRKHSFASALLVTLFLIIVPASLFSQTTSLPISKEKVITIKSDYGGGGVQHHVFVKGLAIIPTDETVLEFPTFQKIIFYKTDWLYKYLFIPDIGKVPLVLNRFIMRAI